MRKAFASPGQILPMMNPTVLYNPNHIVSVAIEGLPQSEVERAMEKAERTVGLTANRQTG